MHQQSGGLGAGAGEERGGRHAGVEQGAQQCAPLVRSQRLDPLVGAGDEQRGRMERAVEQRRGIEVGVVGRPDTEVHGAVGGADRIAEADPLPRRHADRGQERAGRAEPVGVLDRDVQRSGDLPGEQHASVGGSADDVAGRGAEVDAQIACHPRLRGWTEPVDHRSVGRRAVGDS